MEDTSFRVEAKGRVHEAKEVQVNNTKYTCNHLQQRYISLVMCQDRAISHYPDLQWRQNALGNQYYSIEAAGCDVETQQHSENVVSHDGQVLSRVIIHAIARLNHDLIDAGIVASHWPSSVDATRAGIGVLKPDWAISRAASITC